MSHDKKTVKAGRPAFFKDPEVDRLLAIIVRLMTEHSVLNERVKALESLLIDSGALSDDALQTFEPSESQDNEWAQARIQLIKDVLESGANLTEHEQEVTHDIFVAVSTYSVTRVLGWNRRGCFYRCSLV